MFYATRTQQIAVNVSEHQLLKFSGKASRDNFVREIGGSAITAKEANKLMIADVWRTHQGYGMIFHVARYIP